MDPFALPGEASIWRSGNDPRPWDGQAVAEDDAWRPSSFSPEGVEEGIAACRDLRLAARMRAHAALPRRAAELLLARSYASSAFHSFPAIYAGRHERRPRLDLPFGADDFVGVALPSSR
ncbi:MAG: hypothetical protein RBU30_05600 [Polyangia bacterium]|nr:hypothetical protein [Polyangia bacterium]